MHFQANIWGLSFFCLVSQLPETTYYVTHAQWSKRLESHCWKTQDTYESLSSAPSLFLKLKRANFVWWMKAIKKMAPFTEAPNHQLKLLNLCLSREYNSFPHQFEHSHLFAICLMECKAYWKMFWFPSFFEFPIVVHQNLNFPAELVYNSNQTGYSPTL